MAAEGGGGPGAACGTGCVVHRCDNRHTAGPGLEEGSGRQTRQPTSASRVWVAQCGSQHGDGDDLTFSVIAPTIFRAPHLREQTWQDRWGPGVRRAPPHAQTTPAQAAPQDLLTRRTRYLSSSAKLPVQVPSTASPTGAPAPCHRVSSMYEDCAEQIQTHRVLSTLRPPRLVRRWGRDSLQRVGCRACCSCCSTRPRGCTTPGWPAPYSRCSHPCSPALQQFRSVGHGRHGQTTCEQGPTDRPHRKPSCCALGLQVGVPTGTESVFGASRAPASFESKFGATYTHLYIDT